MENNWPETAEELLDECQKLIDRYDLYTLGKRGVPFTDEDEPRVDGTEYLAGEYRYGVAMIPAQWATHVLSNAELGSGTCEVECFDDGVDEMDGELFSYAPPTWYLSCGHTAQGTEMPNFCPECGARIRKAVTR